MNYNELKAEIVRNGFTNVAVAKKMGISKKCLYSRLNGDTSFKLEEIRMLIAILKLSAEQVTRIFFDDVVS